MNDTVLAVRDVTKVFDEGRQRVHVLSGITMDVAPGEVVALEGPSGSGKTTLLSIMGCILTPSSGELEVAGRRVGAADEAALREVRRQSIGFVFQQYNLFPALTALENVEYSLNVRGHGRPRGPRRGEARARRGWGSPTALGFLPRDLSGGQKQRVAIARALAGSPPVLLADEPTANLDTAVGGQILDLFQELAKSEGRGVLVVTHDPKVRRVADRVVGIRDGRLVDGTRSRGEACGGVSGREGSGSGDDETGAAGARSPGGRRAGGRDGAPGARVVQPGSQRRRSRRCRRRRRAGSRRRAASSPIRAPRCAWAPSAPAAWCACTVRGRRRSCARASCSPRSTRTSCAPSSPRRARAWWRPRPRCGCPRRPSRAGSSSSRSASSPRTTSTRRLRDFETARARVETARASVARYEALVAKSRIAAPIAGTLMARRGRRRPDGRDRRPRLHGRRPRAPAHRGRGARGRRAAASPWAPPVKITADGYPGRSWRGTIEEVPDSVTLPPDQAAGPEPPDRRARAGRQGGVRRAGAAAPGDDGRPAHHAERAPLTLAPAGVPCGRRRSPERDEGATLEAA